VKLSETQWTQVSGDTNPLTHGGLFARLNGWSVELLEIQPVTEYVGRAEAKEIGFPIWLRESYHDPDDLDPDNNGDALVFVGLDADASPLAVAVARHEYGHAEPCGGGWATQLDQLREIFHADDLFECDAEFHEDILTD